MGRKKPKSRREIIKPLLRLFLVFGGLLVAFIIAFSIEAVHLAVVAPFTTLVARASSLLMNIFGAGSHVTGNTLSTTAYSINVVDGCNGIYATVILISGVIAYPSRLTQKARGIVLGVLAVFVVNLGRVISLFYLGQHYPNVFEEIHVYVWQPLIILWAILVWHYWSQTLDREKKTG